MVSYFTVFDLKTIIVYLKKEDYYFKKDISF